MLVAGTLAFSLVTCLSAWLRGVMADEIKFAHVKRDKMYNIGINIRGEL